MAKTARMMPIASPALAPPERPLLDVVVEDEGEGDDGLPPYGQ